MKLPKKRRRITIGPHVWKIRYARHLDDAFGRTDTELLTIWLHHDMPRSLHDETLEHEVMHAALFTYGPKLDRDTEEAVVSCLASVVRQVRRENPGVL